MLKLFCLFPLLMWNNAKVGYVTMHLCPPLCLLLLQLLHMYSSFFLCTVKKPENIIIYTYTTAKKLFILRIYKILIKIDWPNCQAILSYILFSEISNTSSPCNRCTNIQYTSLHCLTSYPRLLLNYSFIFHSPYTIG